MKKISIAGLGEACTQFVMGSMVFSPDRMDYTSELLDAYVGQGGNTIDTAPVYSGGDCERAIGKWLYARNNRQQVIIITKGAHPDAQPRVNREAIAKDLRESLERLKTDYIDIYMLHRDDPNIAVGPIIEALNEHIAAGSIRVIGTSNWTHERILEANEYASAHGMIGFSCNSPNLSLAKPNEPRWAGCISADSALIAWHKATRMPLLSWSSQAGGFFTGRYSPERTEDAEMVRVYYSADNWERLGRAEQLARDQATTANSIALAYVLNQPFPTAALIGPRTVDELHSSLEAADISLSAAEINWLDLQD